MTATHQKPTERVMNLLEEGHRPEQIENQLLEEGHDEKFVKELVHQLFTLRSAKRRAHGMSMILIGAVACFASFLLTMNAYFSSNSFPMVLFGLTSVGIIVAFAGLMKVFS